MLQKRANNEDLWPGTVYLFISATGLQHCNATKEVDYVCKINEDYDKNKVPGKLPLTLKPLIMILDVTEVNEVDHSITIYLRLAMNWVDPGLRFVNQSTK